MSVDFQELDKLARTRFRSRFRLSASDHAYAEAKGLATIRSHASDFIAARLAPAAPRNDGRQTPMRGHPAFVAQHATATCCRSCMAKWHGNARGSPMSAAEQAAAVDLVMAWIDAQMAGAGDARVSTKR